MLSRFALANLLLCSAVYAQTNGCALVEVGLGQPCGLTAAQRCASGLCCGASNICASDTSSCGSACQSNYGTCNSATNSICTASAALLNTPQRVAKQLVVASSSTSSTSSNVAAQRVPMTIVRSSSTTSSSSSTISTISSSSSRSSSAFSVLIVSTMRSSTTSSATSTSSRPASSLPANCNLPVDPNGSCGNSKFKCATGLCCSQYGYCGASDIYCGAGCQPSYGLCANSGLVCTAGGGSSSSAPSSSSSSTRSTSTSTASAISPTSTLPNRQAVSRFVGGYFASYSGMSVSAVQFDSLTHVSYFVAAPRADASIDYFGNYDGVIRQLVAAAHGAKSYVAVSLTLGGYTASDQFSGIMASASLRTAFANNIATALATYSFDGVEIDWEYPSAAGDVDNFLTFLKLLRRTLPSQAIITISAPALGYSQGGTKVTNMQAFVPYVNYFMLMAYDLDGIWQGVTAAGSPLTHCMSYSVGVDQVIAFWNNAGVPKSQTILGMPAYGQSYKAASQLLQSVQTTKNTASYAFQKLLSGSTNEPVSYSSLIGSGVLNTDGSVKSASYRRYWDTCQSTPFLFGGSDVRTLVQYEDTTSITAKANLAKSNGLVGIAIFEFSQDYSGKLLGAAVQAFGGGSVKRRGHKQSGHRLR